MAAGLIGLNFIPRFYLYAHRNRKRHAVDMVQGEGVISHEVGTVEEGPQEDFGAANAEKSSYD